MGVQQHSDEAELRLRMPRAAQAEKERRREEDAEAEDRLRRLAPRAVPLGEDAPRCTAPAARSPRSAPPMQAAGGPASAVCSRHGTAPIQGGSPCGTAPSPAPAAAARLAGRSGSLPMPAPSPAAASRAVARGEAPPETHHRTPPRLPHRHTSTAPAAPERQSAPGASPHCSPPGSPQASPPPASPAAASPVRYLSSGPRRQPALDSPGGARQLAVLHEAGPPVPGNVLDLESSAAAAAAIAGVLAAPVPARARWGPPLLLFALAASLSPPLLPVFPHPWLPAWPCFVCQAVPPLLPTRASVADSTDAFCVCWQACCQRYPEGSTSSFARWIISRSWLIMSLAGRTYRRTPQARVFRNASVGNGCIYCSQSGGPLCDETQPGPCRLWKAGRRQPGSTAPAAGSDRGQGDPGQDRAIIRRTPGGSLAQMAAAFAAGGNAMSSFKVISIISTFSSQCSFFNVGGYRSAVKISACKCAQLPAAE